MIPGKWFILFFVLVMLSAFVLATVSSAYFGECFPISFRSTAISWLGMVFVVSGSLGLVAERELYLVINDHYVASACFASIGIMSVPILAFALPEVGVVNFKVRSSHFGPESVKVYFFLVKRLQALTWTRCRRLSGPEWGLPVGN